MEGITTTKDLRLGAKAILSPFYHTLNEFACKYELFISE